MIFCIGGECKDLGVEGLWLGKAVAGSGGSGETSTTGVVRLSL